MLSPAMNDLIERASAKKNQRARPSNDLKYTPLEHIKIPRPVDRLAYISAACSNKRVLDLGALDETAFVQKSGNGTWLHEQIAKVADSVLGLDSSATIPENGFVTAPNARIMKGSVLNAKNLLADINFRPDIVVAGELIEHLDNPLTFLRTLRNIPQLNGAILLLSTPNATAIHNCLIALASRESTHADHLCILSFKTLSTLLVRAGYHDWEIIPYYADFAEMKQRHRGVRKKLIMSGQAAINLIERNFPLL